MAAVATSTVRSLQASSRGSAATKTADSSDCAVTAHKRRLPPASASKAIELNRINHYFQKSHVNRKRISGIPKASGRSKTGNR